MPRNSIRLNVILKIMLTLFYKFTNNLSLHFLTLLTIVINTKIQPC